LHFIAEKKEEVEFEETNENLIYKIAASHLDRSANVLIDSPTKFIEQLPSDEGQ